MAYGDCATLRACMYGNERNHSPKGPHGAGLQEPRGRGRIPNRPRAMAISDPATHGATSAEAILCRAAACRTSRAAPTHVVGMRTLGLSLGSYRLLCLILLPVIMTVGTYLRRFGPRGMFAGSLLFFGFFFGFFLHVAVTAPEGGRTSGDTQHLLGTLRKCLLSSRSRVRVAVGAQVRASTAVTGCRGEPKCYAISAFGAILRSGQARCSTSTR